MKYETLAELVDRISTHQYVLRSFTEGVYEGQTPRQMTEREAHDRNSELRAAKSWLRFKPVGECR